MKTAARHLLVSALLLTPLAGAAAEPPRRDLVLVTTTTLRDSGLLDPLLALFAESSGIRVRPIVTGSGAALRIGSEGNADVLVTHAPEAEQTRLAAGELVDRRPFMENRFVLVGPPEDPAGAGAAPSIGEGLRRLAAAEARFMSRGDDSGTHRRERSLMRAAGLDPDRPWDGVARTGTGMGLTLQLAAERRAYLLSDIATFRVSGGRSGLMVLSRPDPALRNVYAVSRPNPDRFPDGRLRVEGAVRFAVFLFSAPARQLITDFGRDEAGDPLFAPLAPGAAPEAGAP